MELYFQQGCQKIEEFVWTKLLLQADKKQTNRCLWIFFKTCLATNENGGVKAKTNLFPHNKLDLVIFDEYHFGAWKENAKTI